MTTIRQIITDAFRESGVIAAGESPDADKFDEALRRIQNIVDSFFGAELGEPLRAINYGAVGLTNVYGLAEDRSSEVNSIHIPANSRLVFNTDSSKTLYLHPNPEDGARFGILDNGGNFATYNLTLNANGRKIELSNTAVLATNGINREWFYREDLGNWARVTDLTADSENPFPREFDDLLSTLLAVRLNPRYGAETSTETVEVLKRMRKLFRARYKQTKEEESELALRRLTHNRRYWQWGVFSG